MKSFKQKERISDLYTVGRLQKTLEMQKKNEDLKKTFGWWGGYGVNTAGKYRSLEGNLNRHRPAYEQSYLQKYRKYPLFFSFYKEN